MAKKIFITGTGTDVGKTYISALIIKKMREAGFECGYFKPVISGVTEMCGRLIDSDANYVVQMANLSVEPEKCTDCKKTIKAAQGRSPQQISEGTLKNYGRKLCWSCMVKEINRRKELEGNAAKTVSGGTGQQGT